MRFQLYQSHSLTVTGLKIGKKSKYWVFMGPSRDLNVACMANCRQIASTLTPLQW